MTTRKALNGIITVAALFAAGTAFGAIRAATPTVWKGKPDSWQMQRHAEKMKQAAAGGVKVVFIGDSITNGWEQKGRGPEQLKKYFSEGDWKMLNLGYSADRTEHVLWRLDNGELDGYEAKCILLMIGTNNAGHFKKFADEPPSDTILGIREILKKIRAKQPKAKVVLTAIFPRGASENDPFRLRSDVVNREIRKFCDGKTVFWCDFSDRFLDEKGDTNWIMKDRLHPGPQGYEIWYEEVKPYIEYALSDGKLPRPANRFSKVKTAAEKAEENLPETVRPDTRVGTALTGRGAWWLDRLLKKRNQIVASKGKIDVVFLGDSITHNWESKGKAQLAELAKTYSILDIGYGGDRTQHVIWRCQNGELDGYKAKCVMVMIGTNNAYPRNDPKDVVKGIRHILDVISEKQPQAKVLLLPIFVRGEGPQNAQRKANEEVNAAIKSFADGEKVIWVDFNAKYLDAKGDTKWIMPDRVHPNADGYKIWTDAVLPYFKAFCAESSFELQRAEFAKYYQRITGRDAPDGAVRFAIDPTISKSGRDAYSIKSGWRASKSGWRASQPADSGRAPSPALVTITGSNLRSVWYGLYDLLERRGGCHWFWDGDVVPKKDSIDLSGLDIHEEAHFEYRAIRYFAHRGLTRFQAEHWGPEDWKRELDWVLKKRLNVFMLRIGQDDLFQRTFPEACKYPDPSKRLPGAGSSYNDRTLFWSLQYRGKLRREIQKYGFDRGLLAPEDFGTMTHWYSRTPEDWLANMKPAFLPQAHGSASGRNGLVWDIRDEKWVDAYWKLTKTAVEQYGAGAPKPRLLHTIGLSERGVYRERAKNIAQKIEALNKFFARAQRDYPDAKILLSGWDFYGGWKAEEVRKFLPQLDKGRVILWDYEADCQERRDTFVDWDVIGKFPYTYSTILAFEAGLDARADYPFIEKRQLLVQNDPMCVGWIHWPESAHTDTLFLDFFTANAWSEKPIPHEKVLDEFCAGRYGRNAELMKSVWRDVLDASALRRWDEYSESNLNCAQHLIYHGLMKNGFDKRPAQWGPPVKKALAALRRLENVPWDDEFIRRDAIDIVRMVLDRLIILKIDELGCAIAAWRGGASRPRRAADTADGGASRPRRADTTASVKQQGDPVALARELAALFNRLADVLALHTDYSLWESYQRLDAIEKIQNPDFTKTLFENAVNQYCLSHQYEAIRYVVEPIATLLADRISKAVAADDRKARFSVRPEMEGMRRLAKAKPLESLKPTLPRTAESFRKVLGEVLKPVVLTGKAAF